MGLFTHIYIFHRFLSIYLYPSVSVYLSLHTYLCSPDSGYLSLSICLPLSIYLCLSVSFRLSLFTCLCSPVSVYLSLSTSLCLSISAHLSLFTCLCYLCSPVSVHLSLGKQYFPEVSVHLLDQQTCWSQDNHQTTDKIQAWTGTDKPIREREKGINQFD